MIVMPTGAEFRRRAPRLLVGLLLCGVGISLLVRSELGLAPWDILHQGISERTGIPIGTVGILVGLPVLLMWIPLRQPLGVGTLINVIVIGVTIDATLPHTPEPDGIPLRTAFLLGGILVLGLGAGLYIGAGLGPGPRDGLMTGIADKGYSLRVVRTAIELAVLGAGWLLGGTVGVGTVLFALAIGPLCHLFLEWFSVGPLPPRVAETTGVPE